MENLAKARKQLKEKAEKEKEKSNEEVHCRPLAMDMVVIPVTCLIYKLEEGKPKEKWSTIIKIDKNITLQDLKTKFTIDGYGGIKDRCSRLGIERFFCMINVKSKVPDPPEFPAGHIYTASCQEEWEIMLEQLTQGQLTKNTQELLGEWIVRVAKKFKKKCRAMLILSNQA